MRRIADKRSNAVRTQSDSASFVVVWTYSFIAFNKRNGHFHVLLWVSTLSQTLVHSISSYFSVFRVEGVTVVITILKRAQNTWDACVAECDPLFLLEAWMCSIFYGWYGTSHCSPLYLLYAAVCCGSGFDFPKMQTWIIISTSSEAFDASVVFPRYLAKLRASITYQDIWGIWFTCP